MDATFLESLTKNLFLSPGIKRQIIAGWDSFSPVQKRAFTRLVQKTNTIQRSLIERAVENDPIFYANLQAVIRKSLLAEQREAEGKSKILDEREEEALLQMINKLAQ